MQHQITIIGAPADGAAGEVMIGHLIRAADAEKLAFLTDTRAVHNAIFAGKTAAGTYRGTPGSGVARAQRAVFLPRRMPGIRLRDPCMPPEGVANAMADLSRRIRGIWQDRTGGFEALARVCHDFFATHPYLDGNGHICRMMLTLLALRIRLWPRPGWSVHPRPYDRTMSLCLQWYTDHPALLSCHMRQWFDDRSCGLTGPGHAPRGP